MKSFLFIQIAQIFAEKCKRVENYVECTNIENTDRNIIYEKDICNYFVRNSTSLTELHFDSFEKIDNEKCESVRISYWQTSLKSFSRGSLLASSVVFDLDNENIFALGELFRSLEDSASGTLKLRVNCNNKELEQTQKVNASDIKSIQSQISELDLKQCGKVEFEDDFFDNLDNLEELSLQFIGLKEVPSLPTSVKFLDLSFNDLRFLSWTPFSRLDNLKKLKLLGNSFYEIPTPEYQLKLIYFDLSNNRIASLPFNVSSAFPDTVLAFMNNPLDCDLCSTRDAINNALVYTRIRLLKRDSQLLENFSRK
ncbi:unnamed protein product [Oikopleura dioica]|uniref:Uncharacterized protein n=1 Tax=Oikopleura dioica TaxID=34765 RepID=E4XHB2_OIKDI|nr:unnamed protein product [Oikopleura dioica]